MYNTINPLKAKLNPVCHLLALLGSRHILHVSRIRGKLQCIPHHVLHSSSGLPLRRKFLVTKYFSCCVSQFIRLLLYLLIQSEVMPTSFTGRKS